MSAQNHVIVEELDLKRTDNKSFIFKAFSGNITMSIGSASTQRIIIETGAGEVRLRQSINKTMSVEAEIIVAAKNKVAAYESVDEHLSLSLTKEGNEIFLVSLFDYEEQGGRGSFGFFKAPSRKVNIVIYVPANIDVKLNDRSGALDIKNVDNNLSIRDSSGGIRIAGVNGDLRLIDHSGEINISDINEGSQKEFIVDITDYSGELSLNNVTGRTKIVDTSGGLYIDNLVGELEVNDNSGGINISGVQGTVNIQDTSGGISVTEVKGSVEVSDTSGGIYINDVSHDVFLNSDGSGGLTVRNIGGDVKGRINN